MSGSPADAALTPVAAPLPADTPMLARGVTFGGFVDAKDERREHDFATVGVSVGDRSRRRPIRVGLDGSYPGLRKPCCCLPLRRRVGEVQAQLLVAVDRDGLGGLDDFERQARLRQTEYRAVAAEALPERGAQRQADQVAVEPDALLEMR